ncbi:penicillin-binding protein [Lentibacillus cibarius]|uniref:serine-type D-Ala-D-Ala carboxypeptidase n=1 Tax=Lentibacillus cibarius TaxID=2583219 RepID=A0A549YK96_9BACI|nr:penicillin-binding protein [Lentibacillus cibarius]TMN23489.1 penicillin-binding protein [Lentibacillus cibarius]TRM12305.1 penicillin-binding protein [Lentibacillus cibarius]
MKTNKRTYLMSSIMIVLFATIFLLIVGRFLYIQATGEIDNVSLEKWAEEKRTTSYTLDSQRGKIYGRNGMTLAYDRPVYRIQAIVRDSYTTNPEDPRHVKNPEKTAEKLAPLLDTDKNYILRRLTKAIEQERFQVEFGNAGKELSQQTKERIEKLELPGIRFKEESIRYYPNGMFAAHVIGFAQKQDGLITGKMGIEQAMNKKLSGKDGHISYEQDQYGDKLLDPNEIIEKPENGNDVYVTIDQKIQTLLEDVMTQVETEYSPEGITAAVMDPKTGEILAMSNRPSYNPNKLEDVENWNNDIISTPFEPGSTMKMFTWAAAIEEGVYNGNEQFQSGTYKINDRVRGVNDHNWGKGWGTITFDEGFARSSNVAASRLVWEKIGTEAYLNYLKAFDFDEKTGIELPRERKGTLVYNYPRDKITTAFGQATSLTPIQQMKAATAIANDGKMVKPYVISKVVNPATGDVIKEKKPEVVGEPISKETSDHVLNLLGSVVSSEHGTGKKYKLADYSVAGKTGTAQIYEDGSYLTGYGNYIYSFLGMAPKEDPRLMMYVSVKQPDVEIGEESGSTPVAFIFKNVMQKSLHYLDIEPDKDTSEQVNPIELPKLTGKNTSSIKQTLKEKGLNVTLIGSGDTIKAASAVKGEELLEGDRIILVTNKPVMPDITGWSMRDVLQLANLLDLKVETMGNGYVIKQSVTKGTPLKKNDYLGVELEPPEPMREQTEGNDHTETDDGSDEQA